jgi:hypothetical protein
MLGRPREDWNEIAPAVAAEEQQIQTSLLRDIVGNPFRPPVIDPGWLSWQDGAVPRLARALYEERGFDHLPILADALEEAGCTDAEILGHCRGPGSHTRGCWLVDSLLGEK